MLRNPAGGRESLADAPWPELGQGGQALRVGYRRKGLLQASPDALAALRADTSVPPSGYLTVFPATAGLPRA